MRQASLSTRKRASGGHSPTLISARVAEGAPVLKTNYLLAHVLQQLLGDIASIPHTSHRNPS
jgi:hypothetical protein